MSARSDLACDWAGTIQKRFRGKKLGDWAGKFKSKFGKKNGLSTLDSTSDDDEYPDAACPIIPLGNQAAAATECSFLQCKFMGFGTLGHGIGRQVIYITGTFEPHPTGLL